MAFAFVAAALFVSGLAPTQDTFITFDDVPPGPLDPNHYAAQGVHFGVSPFGAASVPFIESRPDIAPSAPNIAVATVGCGGEFPTTQLWLSFDDPHHRLEFVALELNGQTYEVDTFFYDRDGNELQLVEARGTVGPGHTPAISIDLGSVISFSYAVITAPIAFNCLAVDNLSFDTAQNPLQPDFSLSWAGSGLFIGNALQVAVPLGGSVTANMMLHRYNGSFGAIAFDAPLGFPHTAFSFSPNPSAGADGSLVQVTVSADPLASQEGAIEVSLEGLAQVASAGTLGLPRTLDIFIYPYAPFDLRARGLEVTQSIQTENATGECDLPGQDGVRNPNSFLYSGLQLAAGGKTVAILYADAVNAGSLGVAGVTANLRAFDQQTGAELPGSPIMAESSPRALSQQADCVTQVERIYQDGAFQFTLPVAWTHGTIRLVATVFPPQSTFAGPPPPQECGGCQANNSIELTGIPFTPMNRLAIRPVAMYSFQNGCSEFPPEQDPPAVFAAAQSTTPVPLDIPATYVGSIDVCDIEFSVDPDDLAEDQLSDLGSRLQDWDRDHRGFGFAFGILKAEFDPGGVEVPWGNHVAVASFSEPGIVAHELGHLLGRVHASYCGGGGDNGQNAESWPPDQVGSIQGVGLDRRGSAPYAIVAANNPLWLTRVYDFMSYCSPKGKTFPSIVQGTWISTRGWQENILAWAAGAPGTGAPIVAGAPAGLQLPPQGALDVFALATPTDARITLVADAIGTAPPMGSSSYTVAALDGSGRTLFQYPMGGAALGDLGASSFLEARIPSAAQVQEIDILSGNTVIASRRRSAHPPVLRIQSPDPNVPLDLADVAQIAWSATDADGDPLTARLEFSADDGLTFTTIFLGGAGGGVQLPSAHFSRSTTARLRLRANDGFTDTATISSRFTAVGRPPIVHITSPAQGASVPVQSTILLAGAGSDDAKRMLQPAALTWYGRIGDKRQRIGSGPAMSFSIPRSGSLCFDLVGQDAFGRTGSDSVCIQATP